MAKHTKGPWFRLTGGVVSNSVGPHWPSPDHFVADVPNDANARLIAAAPTMFDALESLVGLVEELVPEHDDIGEQGHDPENCSICEARIAIRRATGEE